MPRSSTTKPKRDAPAGGAGWGGPAKGAAARTAGPGRPKGVKTGEGKAATFRSALAPHTQELADKWLAIARQDGHPHQHTMLVKAAELAGEMKQAVELTGKDGGPVSIASLDPVEAAREYQRIMRGG